MTKSNRDIISVDTLEGGLEAHHYDTLSVRIVHRSKSKGTVHLASITGLPQGDLLTQLILGCQQLYHSPQFQPQLPTKSSKLIVEINGTTHTRHVEVLLGSHILSPAEKFLAVASMAHHRINLCPYELLAQAESGWRLQEIPADSLRWGLHLVLWLLPDFSLCLRGEGESLLTVPRDFTEPGSYLQHLRFINFLDSKEDLEADLQDLLAPTIRLKRQLVQERAFRVAPLVGAVEWGSATSYTVLQFMEHYLPTHAGHRDLVTYDQMGLATFLWLRYREGFVSHHSTLDDIPSDWTPIRETVSCLITPDQYRQVLGTMPKSPRPFNSIFYHYLRRIYETPDSVLFFTSVGSMGCERACEFFTIALKSRDSREDIGRGSFKRKQLLQLLEAIRADDGQMPVNWTFSFTGLDSTPSHNSHFQLL